MGHGHEKGRFLREGGDLFRGNESGATFLFIDRDIIILDAA